MHRIWDALNDASLNIRREETFYSEVIKDYDLTSHVVEDGPGRATTDFMDLFSKVGNSTLLEGMVLLWATEYVYLNAWKHARDVRARLGPFEQMKFASEGEKKVALAMQEKFIPNWSSEEFEGFVDNLAGLVDELAKGFEGEDELYKRCEEAWKDTLAAEANFWPAPRKSED